MSIYKKWIKDEIEISDMSQEQFNRFMIERYNDYKSRGGIYSFQEFVDMCAITD